MLWLNSYKFQGNAKDSKRVTNLIWILFPMFIVLTKFQQIPSDSKRAQEDYKFNLYYFFYVLTKFQQTPSNSKRFQDGINSIFIIPLGVCAKAYG